MPKIVKRELLLVKIETTQGDDAIPTAALDAILVEEPAWSYLANMIERNPIKGTLGKMKHLFAGTLIEATFKSEIKGSGTAGTVPEASAALRGCGLGETIVAVTSVAYSPVSTGQESVTIYYYEDGSYFKLLGCMGNVNISLPTGERAMYEFTFTGHLAGPVDITLPSGTFDDQDPIAVLGGTFTIGGEAAAIQAINLDVGNEISTPQDFSAADGYSDIFIADNDPNGSFNPQAELVATIDFHGDWRGGVEGALLTGDIGSTAGEKFSLSCPTVAYRELAQGDRDGLRTLEIGFGAHGDDSAFELMFD